MSSLLSLLLFSVDAAVVAVLRQGDVYLDVLSDACAVLAWLVHLGAVATLRRSAVFGTRRGPASLPLLVLLSAPNLVLTLVTFCRHGDDGYLSLTQPLKVTRLALACARALALLLYLLAFLFPCSASSHAAYSLHIDAADGPPLLQQ